MAITFTLNGKRVSVGSVDPHTTLLAWLRREGFTATKEGCAEGECGACAVALVRKNHRGETVYQPVNSCLVLLPAVDGHEVVTAEGVARDAEQHPVQLAMLRGGSQCGYCTPGFVVSLFAEYYRPGRDGYDPEAISGNLCRCTGYRPIIDAAKSLGAPAADDPAAQRLSAPAPELGPTDHVGDGRRFYRPTRLDDALSFLAEHPDATPIAGGTDLVVYANQRYDRFGTLLSLEAIDELRSFEWSSAGVVIGAGLPLAELEDRLHDDHRGELPLLETLLPLFSSRLVRNRATLGGNLATASPIGDSPPALLALDAEVTAGSVRGQRTIPLGELFTGYRTTQLERDELIVSVRIPRPFPAIQRFYKVSKRVLDDISTVAAGFGLDLARDGTVERIRLAFGGVAATPVRARDAEQVIEGQPWNAATVEKAREALRAAGTPMTDHRGSSEYRAAMMTRLVDKLLYETTAPSSSSAEVRA